MLPLWAVQQLIKKPGGAPLDFLKGFWNGFTGKKSTPAPAPAGQTYIYEETSSSPKGKDNTLLYIGIAAGTVILIIVIIAMTS